MFLQTPGEYEEEYKKDSSTFSRFHGYAYDGVWALALAMQYVDHRVKAVGQTLLDFHYKNETWQDLLIEALDRTSFEGVTVSVRHHSAKCSCKL
jgi:gamma-aminobutyric acid type B receptor